MNSSTPTAPIVVGVDGSASSVIALRKAAELAATMSTNLLVVTSWRVPNFYNDYLDLDSTAFEQHANAQQNNALTEAFGNNCPVPAERRLCHGRPAVELCQAAANAQLLVLGTRGHGEFATMILGSVSLECIAHAPCPVLTVRGPITGPPRPASSIPQYDQHRPSSTQA